MGALWKGCITDGTRKKAEKEMEERKRPENLISLATLAKRLDRTTRTVLRWQKEVGLPRYGMGRSPLFDWEEVLVVLRTKRPCYGSEGCVKDCEKCRKQYPPGLMGGTAPC